MRLSSDDAEIFYTVMGAGPPVVLLHPFPANHKVWLPAAELLAGRYRLIVPDLRGHGQSSAGAGPATMQKHATDLLRLSEACGVGKAVFAGVSIGGYVLFEFWRRHRERVSGLILCDTRAGADTDEGRANRLKAADDAEKQGPVPFVDSMIPKLLGDTTRTTRPDLVERARKMMLEMSAAGIAAVQRGMAARPDSVADLKTINVPTLVMVGAEDTLTPLSEAEFMQRGIAGSRLQVAPRAGHYAVFEQHEAAGKAIRGFLDGIKTW
ncbi:MAG TPA: alpha/beta fold hydrolase [Terriglobales bacterium]|nr:alpha/beta fold hydrolase [Terriglobales bacterium]